MMRTMKLTQFTDYSLRVLIYLATDPERRATIAEIARAFEVSESHLTKVVHHLSKCQYLSTVRGKGGGMGLGRAPSDIRIGDVVQSTEGASMPAECFDPERHTCVIDPVCLLRGALREATQAFYAQLNHYTLADITRNRAALHEVLFFHRETA